MTKDGTVELKEILATAEAWFVWVMEYGITHHLMRLALHTGDYPRCIEVICADASHFEGSLQCGPYRLRIIEHTTPTGAETVLVGNEGELRIRCRTLEIVRRRV